VCLDLGYSARKQNLASCFTTASWRELFVLSVPAAVFLGRGQRNWRKRQEGCEGENGSNWKDRGCPYDVVADL